MLALLEDIRIASENFWRNESEEVDAIGRFQQAIGLLNVVKEQLIKQVGGKSSVRQIITLGGKSLLRYFNLYCAVGDFGGAMGVLCKQRNFLFKGYLCDSLDRRDHPYPPRFDRSLGDVTQIYNASVSRSAYKLEARTDNPCRDL